MEKTAVKAQKGRDSLDAAYQAAMVTAAERQEDWEKAMITACNVRVCAYANAQCSWCVFADGIHRDRWLTFLANRRLLSHSLDTRRHSTGPAANGMGPIQHAADGAVRLHQSHRRIAARDGPRT